MSRESLTRLRALHGATAVVWAGDALEVSTGGWRGLTGAPSVDFNVVLCHGASDGRALAEAMEAIAAVRQPALVMVAGDALAEVQSLVRASWVCVGAVAFDELPLGELTGVALDGRVRRLGLEELDAARSLVCDVFGYDLGLARTALSDANVRTPGRAVWGAFDSDDALVTCAATAVHEDVVGVWSMATSPDRQRRGYASRLLRTALADARDQGAARCLLTASIAGEPFYEALGFHRLERWQVWSRPRWVIGRF